MVFHFKTETSYVEAYEYLLRILQSFYYNSGDLSIEIDDPNDELVERLNNICQNRHNDDELLATQIKQQQWSDNVAG